MEYVNDEIIEDLPPDEIAVFMKAYFDESGKHHQSEVITVAGTIAAELHPTKAMRDPWYLTFELGIGAVMAHTQNLGKRHVLQFNFDRQDEFQKTAHKLFDQMLNQKPANAPSYLARMGSLTFLPKDQVAPLQAIDLITYEANRYVWECHLGGSDERWQNKRIRKTVHVNGFVLDRKALHNLRDMVIADRAKLEP